MYCAYLKKAELIGCVWGANDDCFDVSDVHVSTCNGNSFWIIDMLAYEM